MSSNGVAIEKIMPSKKNNLALAYHATYTCSNSKEHQKTQHNASNIKADIRRNDTNLKALLICSIGSISISRL